MSSHGQLLLQGRDHLQDNVGGSYKKHLEGLRLSTIQALHFVQYSRTRMLGHGEYTLFPRRPELRQQSVTLHTTLGDIKVSMYSPETR